MITISTLAIFFTLNHHSFQNNMKQVLMHANMHQDSKITIYLLYIYELVKQVNLAVTPCINQVVLYLQFLSFSLFRIIICSFVFLFTICISVKIRSSYCFTLSTFGVVTGFFGSFFGSSFTVPTAPIFVVSN